MNSQFTVLLIVIKMPILKKIRNVSLYLKSGKRREEAVFKRKFFFLSFIYFSFTSKTKQLVLSAYKGDKTHFSPDVSCVQFSI
jgi:hypothetical protein